MGKKKLDLIIEAIADAKEVTRKGHEVKVYIRRDNQLVTVYPEELYDILLKLQDEDRIIRVKTFPHERSYRDEDTWKSLWRDGKLHFSVEILEPFDKWGTDYRAKAKSSIQLRNPITREDLEHLGEYVKSHKRMPNFQKLFRPNSLKSWVVSTLIMSIVAGLIVAVITGWRPW